MARTRYTSEREIICLLRTVEIEAGRGIGLADACRKLGITEQTYYRWKKEYGGLGVGSLDLACCRINKRLQYIPQAR